MPLFVVITIDNRAIPKQFKEGLLIPFAARQALHGAFLVPDTVVAHPSSGLAHIPPGLSVHM